MGMTVASAGPYANNLHLTPNRQPHQHLIIEFFTDHMLFLMPNQQSQLKACTVPNPQFHHKKKHLRIARLQFLRDECLSCHRHSLWLMM